MAQAMIPAASEQGDKAVMEKLQDITEIIPVSLISGISTEVLHSSNKRGAEFCWGKLKLPRKQTKKRYADNIKTDVTETDYELLQSNELAQICLMVALVLAVVNFVFYYYAVSMK
jgi:hypothetical protein